MYALPHRLHRGCFALLTGVFVLFGGSEPTLAQQLRHGMIEQLQQRFGLQEPQVRSALGALLVFAREQLPKPEFDEFAAAIPDAYQIIDETKMRGIVTRPLDDIGDYEDSLASVGIAPAIAAQIPSAVLEYLAAAGRERERSILARILS